MCTLARVLLLLAVTVLHLAGPAEARRVALVIGNGKYMHTSGLPNTVGDARALGAALERMQFDRVIIHEDLDVASMRNALLDFESEASAADIALVYFAGHGMEIDGLNYLIPTDARLRTTSAAEIESIPLSTITSMMAGARSLRIVILDACRNNPIRPQLMADATRKRRSMGRGLKSVEPGDNELIAFAAAAGTEADDGDGRHSPFATALLKHIERPELEIGQLFRVVRDDVMKATRREQTPHVYGSLGSEQIYLARPRVASPIEREAPSPGDPTAETRQMRIEHTLLLLEAARRSADQRPQQPASIPVPVPTDVPLPRQAAAEVRPVEAKPAETKPQPVVRTSGTAVATETGRCESIAGRWTWFGRVLAMDVHFSPNGTGTAASGVRGTWSCTNGRYRISWINGYTDTMMLSPDGRRLSGRSAFGNRISAHRK